MIPSLESHGRSLTQQELEVEGKGEKTLEREMGTLRSNLQRKNLTVAHTCAAEMHRWKRPLYYDNGQTANSYGMCTVRFMEILQ